MKLGRKGTTALEFGLVAPVLLTLISGGLESGRYFWTWQAAQLVGDQTARCVAIASPACLVPAVYAVAAAGSYGATVDPARVVVDTVAPGSTSCAPPAGNSAIRVRLAVTFGSPLASLVPFLSPNFTTVSCYPLTGK